MYRYFTSRYFPWAPVHPTLMHAATGSRLQAASSICRIVSSPTQAVRPPCTSGGGPPGATSDRHDAGSRFSKPRDFKKEPFKRFVIMGESTVHGGPWLPREEEDRYADVLVRLINACQEKPVEYHNKGISANA